jgi:hypothetical protein
MTPMRNRPLWMRTPLLLLTLLQLAVPGAAAWADGRLGEGSTGPAHIESHSTDICARVHPADCAFHRFLTTPLARGTLTVLRIREGQGLTWAASGTQGSKTTSDVTLPDSRAPPTLS